MDVIPLTRYRLMTDYLGQRGELGTSMMRLTSSVQINFDYSNEAEAIQMLQVGLAAAPLSTALFGNSPFSSGKPNGWLSFRSEIWRNTDPDRQGLLPEAFAPGFSFEKYAELAWKRPLMFVQNDGGSHVESHQRSLQEIALGQLKNCSLNEENEMTALRQLFTEARLKPGYVEVRSIDGLRVADRYAAVAFWTGLMYSEPARLFVLDKLGTLSPKQREELWIAAGREGLKATAGGVSLHSLAKEVLEVSRKSLLRRGLQEERFLEPVERTVVDGKNPADRLLEAYLGPWKQDM
jgi:glutamate--cysteine ligase